MIEKPELLNAEAVQAACIHLTVPALEMAQHMDPAIAELIRTIIAQGAVPAGPLFSYHLRRPSETFDFEIGFPVAQPIDPKGRVRMIERPAFRVVRTVYTGPYDGLAEGWQQLQAWVREKGWAEPGRFWESYLTNPDDEPDPQKLRTELNWVVEKI